MPMYKYVVIFNLKRSLLYFIYFQLKNVLLIFSHVLRFLCNYFNDYNTPFMISLNFFNESPIWTHYNCFWLFIIIIYTIKANSHSAKFLGRFEITSSGKVPWIQRLGSKTMTNVTISKVSCQFFCNRIELIIFPPANMSGPLLSLVFFHFHQYWALFL